MRRSDREIKSMDEILDVIKRCDVCRLAFNDPEGYPYILPLNFGMQLENDKIVLYFHGAAEGKKYQLLEQDARVSFEMDCGHRLVMSGSRDSCHCTMEYESVMGRGRAEIVPDEQKYDALCVLMRQYHEENCTFNKAAMPRTTVLRVVVEQITGKRRMKKE